MVATESSEGLLFDGDTQARVKCFEIYILGKYDMSLTP